MKINRDTLLIGIGIAVAVILYLLGYEIFGTIAGILTAGEGARERKQRKQAEKAQQEAKQAAKDTDNLREKNDERIAKAGEDVEANHHDNADSAAHAFDEYADDNSSE